MMEKVATQNVFPTQRPVSNAGAHRVSNQPLQPKELMKTEEKSFHLNDKQQHDVQTVVESLNKFLQPSKSSLKFVYHEELNEYFVTVIDDITKEVIKEIPPKKLLDLYAAMTEFVGLMVDKKI